MSGVWIITNGPTIDEMMAAIKSQIPLRFRVKSATEDDSLEKEIKLFIDAIRHLENGDWEIGGKTKQNLDFTGQYSETPGKKVAFLGFIRSHAISRLSIFA